jgi:ubiquinone/menaquinone biosynthesis C-methylase UbiE
MTTSAQSFDGFAEQYDEAASLERKHGFFLDNLPRKRESVLDVGCGSGLLSHELSRHFRTVVALDISEPMLAVARKKRSAPNIDYRLCDVNRFSTEARFDAVVSHTAFHHLPEIPATLGRLKNLLTPHGRLIAVDCIARFPALIPRWSLFYRVYAALQVLPDRLQRGAGAARTLWRFRTCRAWIAHLKSDQYFSPARFREVYTSCLPGAQFVRLKTFMAVIWTAPGKEESKQPNQTLEPTSPSGRGSS